MLTKTQCNTDNRNFSNAFRLSVILDNIILILLPFCFGVAIPSDAQNTFSCVFQKPGIENALYMIEDSDQSILAVGGQTRLSNPTKGAIWKIDKNNDTLTKNYGYLDKDLYFTYIEETSGDEYIVSGFTVDTNENDATDLIFFRLNQELEVIWQKTIALNHELYGSRLKKQDDYYYLLMSASQNSGHPDPYFIKLNSEFDTVRTYHSGYLLGGQYIQDFTFSPDGSQIYIFADGFIFDQNDLGDHNEIIFYDTAFNYLGFNNFPYEGINGAFSNYMQGQQFADTTLLMYCNYISYSDHTIQHCFMEMDTAMNIYNRTIFGVPDTNDVGCMMSKTYSFSTPDSIHYAGTKNYIVSFQPDEISWLRIGMLNRQLQPYYMRFYGGDAQYLIEYVLHTSDGGMVIHAMRLEDFTYTESDWDAFFLKVDKNGLITGITSPEICPLRSFLLSPNPGSNEVHLDLAPFHAQLLIYNVSGILVHSQTLTQGTNLINTTKLPKGIYIFSVTDENNNTSSQKWIKQ